MLNRTWLAAVPAIFLAACASTPAPAPITDTTARTPGLGTLAKLIDEAGLADTLRGPGPYTVFAPSDEAFKAVPAKTMAELTADKAYLKAVLSHHVLAGRTASADVKAGSAKALDGNPLVVGAAGSFVTVDDAVVLQADVPAANGVVHVIDRVLLPPKK
jgi:uncharacterized surface protein with fasciclin (FAS1) repeats